MVSRLVRQGESVNQYTWQNKTTALHEACKHNHHLVVRLLIDNGADAMIFDEHKKAPVDYASEKGFKMCVDVITGENAYKEDFE